MFAVIFVCCCVWDTSVSPFFFEFVSLHPCIESSRAKNSSAFFTRPCWWNHHTAPSHLLYMLWGIFEQQCAPHREELTSEFLLEFLTALRNETWSPDQRKPHKVHAYLGAWVLGMSQLFFWPHTPLEWQVWGYCAVLEERAPFRGTWRTQRWLQITATGTFSCFVPTRMDFLFYHTVWFEEKPVSAAVLCCETETARTDPKMDSVQIWHFSSEFSGEQLRASACSVDTAWEKVS